MRYKIFIAILLIATLWSCISVPLPEKWDKDYYSYHVGAYINGVEYHESCGYTYHPKWFRCEQRYKDGWAYLYFISNSPYIVPKPYSDDHLWITITVAVDSTHYQSGQVFYFDDAIFECHKNITTSIMGEIFDLDTREYISGPWSVFYLYDNKDDVAFNAVDGWISFGEFDQVYNRDIVRFECTAVNEKGDTLHITNGFVNKFDQGQL